MYAPPFPCAQQQVEEDYFANINYSKSVECILPTAELLINFRLNGLRAKKPCFVYAEKMDFKGLIQLRITEKCDQRRMYITTVDSTSFNELKQDQSLHVTFTGFIENLVRILQDCQTGKLEINLVQLQQQMDVTLGAGASVSDYQLQFVEMRAFKNLIHLCLPCRMAPLNVVLFYMNSILDTMQKKGLSYENTAQQLQRQVSLHLRSIEQLNAENAKLRDNLLETTRNLTQRHTEELQQMQESVRKASEQRHTDNERNRKTIVSLQTQLDKLSAEHTNLEAGKAQEHKRNEMLHEDLASTKSQAAKMKEQNEKLHADISALKNLERKHEMHLGDARKHIGELQDKLNKYDKAKADIVAEIEAEKKISQTKRQALEMATEEISKANEIILKQAQELLKLKKTVGWRTEVALEQEKAINENEKLLKLNKDEIKCMQQTIEALRLEIPKQLKSMREFANSLEQKYAEQIKSLKDKLKCVDKENYPPAVPTISSRHK